MGALLFSPVTRPYNPPLDGNVYVIYIIIKNRAPVVVAVINRLAID